MLSWRSVLDSISPRFARGLRRATQRRALLREVGGLGPVEGGRVLRDLGLSRGDEFRLAQGNLDRPDLLPRLMRRFGLNPREGRTQRSRRHARPSPNLRDVLGREAVRSAPRPIAAACTQGAPLRSAERLCILPQRPDPCRLSRCSARQRRGRRAASCVKCRPSLILIGR